MIDLRLHERARERARKFRRVARGISNARVEAVGDEADRIRRRRATMVAKMNQLAMASESAAEHPEREQDAAHMGSLLDHVLDDALISFQTERAQQGVDLIVASLDTVDEILEALSAPDVVESPSVLTPVRADGVKHTHAKEGGGQQTHTHADANVGHAHNGLLPLPAAANALRSPRALHARSVEEARQEGNLKGGYRAMECGVRASADGSGQNLYGHFAVFNEWTEIDSMFEGHFMEQIAPGAFEQTFREDQQDMRVLLNHGRDPELGSKPIAVINELSEDKTGANYDATLLRGVPDLVIDGIAKRQYGASFRFEVLSESWVDKPKRSDYNPMGLPERTMTGLRVAEFGPVTFPQYTTATAGLRSLTDAFMSAGRPVAGSAGGSRVTANVSPEVMAELEARDRELQMKGVIK